MSKKLEHKGGKPLRASAKLYCMRIPFALLRVLLVCSLPLTAAEGLAGRPAPGFALPDSGMKYHDLGEYRGKLVVLDIMQTRCPNCQILTQTLEKIKKAYGDKIAVVSVVNPPDNQSTVAEHIRKYGVTTPVLFDCGQMAGSYLLPDPRNPSIHLPHLFLIDRKGVIRKHFGPDREDVFKGSGLAEEIDRLLGEALAAERKGSK